MKKKVAIIFAGLGLCASLVMFTGNEYQAQTENSRCLKACSSGGVKCVRTGNTCLYESTCNGEED